MPKTSDRSLRSSASSPEKKTIILFGGAFDPPHNGHLHMAEAACDALNPDKLLWIPTANPAHRDQPKASFQQRSAMIELIIRHQSNWELCTIENKRPEKSYFIDTLNALILQEGPAQFYVLIGQDQLDNFTRWHRFTEILEKASLIVMPRQGARKTTLVNHPIFLLNVETCEMSSTAIRKGPVPTSLPEVLRRYIEEEKIYT